MAEGEGGLKTKIEEDRCLESMPRLWLVSERKRDGGEGLGGKQREVETGEPEAQSYPWLHSEFKVSLGIAIIQCPLLYYSIL